MLSLSSTLLLKPLTTFHSRCATLHPPPSVYITNNPHTSLPAQRKSCRPYTMVFSATLAALLLTAVEGCLVEKYEQITNTADTLILSLIKPDKPMIFVVEFVDHSLTFWRDYVELTNSRMTLGKLRNGQSISQTEHDLPLKVIEGWNKLRLEAVSTRFKLTHLLEGDEEETLPDLELDFPVSSVHVMGTFSICQEDSPEWEVAEGQEVSVPLQPETSHMLQVTGGGNAAPYLLDSSSSSKSLITISPNTSLTIVTWRHNSVTEVEVSQIGTENNKVVLVKMEQHDASPTMQMGCSAGTLHLRLNLAIPPTPPLFSVLAPSPTPPGTKEYLSTDSPGDSKALWPMGYVLFFCGMAIGCLITVMVVLLVLRIRARRATTSGEVVPYTACKEKFLPA